MIDFRRDNDGGGPPPASPLPRRDQALESLDDLDRLGPERGRLPDKVSSGGAAIEDPLAMRGNPLVELAHIGDQSLRPCQVNNAHAPLP